MRLIILPEMFYIKPQINTLVCRNLVDELDHNRFNNFLLKPVVPAEFSDVGSSQLVHVFIPDYAIYQFDAAVSRSIFQDI